MSISSPEDLSLFYTRLRELSRALTGLCERGRQIAASGLSEPGEPEQMGRLLEQLLGEMFQLLHFFGEDNERLCALLEERLFEISLELLLRQHDITIR